MIRIADRPFDTIRPITLTYGIYEYAIGSVLIQIGKTKVLCSVSFSEGVPQFLRGSGSGWLTAEYAMLPASTHTRIERDSIKNRQGRNVEISRLIGRSLRSSIDLRVLGERTLIIDCDILQADGGTRSAAITGASAALRMAQNTLLHNKKIAKPFLIQDVAAISVGIKDNTFLLDLDCNEDKTIDADFNFVFTRSGRLIEIQGSSEKGSLAWDDVVTMKHLATKGIQDLFTTIDTYDCLSHIQQTKRRI
jgi:ribonuclease PH